LTADEVAEMERQKRNENGDEPAEGVKEIDRPNPAAARTPNKGSQSRVARGNTPSSGSLKRKAGHAGMTSGSPLKKSKAGNGNGRMALARMPSESDDDGLGLVEG
jgi:nuclear transcription factor Y alpha